MITMNRNTLRAIVLFADNYHSGQWSRGYRLGCAARRALLRRNMPDPYGFPFRGKTADTYDYLVRTYANKI